jgi:hypothetical protein
LAAYSRQPVRYVLQSPVRLAALSFSGIKSFDALQRMPIRQLTLIYGPNSSGKSSVFQALLLLKQSVQRAWATEPGVLEFRGGVADLGGFRTFVHGHDTSRQIELGLELTGVRRRSSLAFFGHHVHVAMKFGLQSDDDREPHLLEITLRDDLEIRFKYDPAVGEMRLADAESSANLISKWATVYDRYRSSRPSDYPESTDADKRWLREWARKHGCKLNGWIPYWPPSEIARGKPGRPYGGSLSSPRNQHLQSLIYWWQNWSSDFSYQLYQMLTDIVYVGPLREFPRRVATEASDAAGVGVRGERLVLHLARHDELVAQVNTAFKSLEIPYRLKVEQVLSEPVQDALGDVAIVILKDERTGFDVSPADVGFGLSQVLPVVVQVLGNTNSIVLIEQPEIHLHPKVQSRLADMFIGSTLTNKNQVLIETHSEHILLRAQRRVREQHYRAFRASALGVQYVSLIDGRGAVQDLRVAEDGKLVDPWPDGFFDERFDDLFVGL